MQLVMSNESYRFSNPTSTHADPEEAEGEEDEKEEIADELEGYWKYIKTPYCNVRPSPSRLGILLPTNQLSHFFKSSDLIG